MKRCLLLVVCVLAAACGEEKVGDLESAAFFAACSSDADCPGSLVCSTESDPQRGRCTAACALQSDCQAFKAESDWEHVECGATALCGYTCRSGVLCPDSHPFCVLSTSLLTSNCVETCPEGETCDYRKSLK